MAGLHHPDDGEWLRENLGELGARHTGVTEETYGWVADTLARVAGDGWSPAHDAASRDALAAIAALMLAGGGRTRPWSDRAAGGGDPPPAPSASQGSAPGRI